MDIIIGDQTLKLPAAAARKLRGKRLRVVETPAGVLVQPEEQDPIAAARGALKGGKLTMTKFMRMKREDQALES